MTNKKSLSLLRTTAASALVLAFSLNPLAAQDRFYFRNVETAPKATGTPSNPLHASLVMGSANVIVGQSVNLVPVAQNIPAPISWTLTGSLPAGLGLDASTGAVSGIASTAGTGNLTLHASGGGKSASAPFTVTVSPVPANPPILSSYPSSFTFVAGEAFTIPGPTVSGGIGPFSYSVAPGGAPFGFSTSDGSISWTPPAATTIEGITVRATGSNQESGSSNPFSIVVNPALVAGSYGLAKELFVSDSVTYPLTGAAGGMGALSYSISGGAQPPGLSLDASGAFVGTATAAGNYGATVLVSDQGGRQSSTNFSATVYPPFLVTTPSTPQSSAVRGTPITTSTLSVDGGKPPYSYSHSELPPGLGFASGSLYGTPTAPGSYSFTLTATESLQSRSTTVGPFTMVVANPAAPSIATASAPQTEPTQGHGIGPIALIVSNGLAPVSLALTGNVPPGIALTPNQNGGQSLSGSFSTVGSYEWGVVATDSLTPTAQTGSLSFTTTVYSPFSATLSQPLASTLNQGVAMTPVSYQGTGGKAPYVYDVPTGALPSGVTYANGVLSGTPDTQGSYSFALRVRDSSSPPKESTSAMLGTTVIPAALSIGTPQVPTYMTVGTPITTLNFTGSGGKPPYTYSQSSLPFGLTWNGSTGTISGTPNNPGVFNLQVTVSDSSTPTASYVSSQVFPIEVSQPLIAGFTSLPGATSTVPYPTFTATASGGKAPYTYALTGTLPTGLAWSASNATISGTPTADGTFGGITISVTDANGRVQTRNNLSIVVSSLPAASRALMTDVTVSTPYSGGVFQGQSFLGTSGAYADAVVKAGYGNTTNATGSQGGASIQGTYNTVTYAYSTPVKATQLRLNMTGPALTSTHNFSVQASDDGVNWGPATTFDLRSYIANDFGADSYFGGKKVFINAPVPNLTGRYLRYTNLHTNIYVSSGGFY